MDSDNDQDDLPMNGSETSFHRRVFESRSNGGRIFAHVQRFLPEQMIIYIQYCLLRIPFLLVYDYLFTDQFARWIDSFFLTSIEIIDEEKQSVFLPISFVLQNYFFQTLVEMNLLLSIPTLGLILLIGLMLCSDRQLMLVYSYTISFLVIYFSYQINRSNDFPHMFIALQLILAGIYIQLLNIRPGGYSSPIQQRCCYTMPILSIVNRYFFSLNGDSSLLPFLLLFWTVILLAEVFLDQRQSIIQAIRTTFLNEISTLYENIGFQSVLNYLQENIHILTLLKIFWLTKVLVIPLGIRETYSNPFLNRTFREENLTLINGTIENSFDYNATLTKTIYFTTIYYGTETVLTLISLSCIIAHGMKVLSHRLFRLLHLWTDEVEQIGTVMGVMLFLLLFQSNLTRLDLHRRHVPLLKAFSLLFVALFHFLHTILEPQLLKVAMQTMTKRMAFDEDLDGNNDDDERDDQKTKKKFSDSLMTSFKVLRSFHHRHVYTCLIILLVLFLYLLSLWRLSSFSTWLLAITAFSLELIVRLTASLAQYTLYVLDAHNLLSNSDSFDEYIFRIKAVTSCFEFILGVFLLFNGLYILFFEARGALRAFMLAIHAHLNIIKNFRRGWKILRNRRSASDNVNRLQLATEEQIRSYNDICSICHNPLTLGQTCVTPCSHLFHKKCLQKAFYATENCALCSRPIVFDRTEQQRRQEYHQ